MNVSGRKLLIPVAILAVGLGLWPQATPAGVVTCSAGTAGGGLATCTGVQRCLATITPDTLVRTLSGPAHIWQRWDVITPTGTVRLCQPDSWNSKQASGITVTTPPEPAKHWVCTPAVTDETTIDLKCRLQVVQ